MGFAEPVPWLHDFAARAGLRYEPDADERWFRAWEPFATLRVPVHYTHALHTTSPDGHSSISIARMGLTIRAHSPTGAGLVDTEMRAWVAIVQDARMSALVADGPVAVTSDRGSAFSETWDLISLPRRMTGDGPFDQVFATFSKTADTSKAISKSLRKLLLSWRAPVHAEVRAGGFVLCPTLLPADPASVSWLLTAAGIFGNKATKPES